jgi:hypothetical protein
LQKLVYIPERRKKRHLQNILFVKNNGRQNTKRHDTKISHATSIKPWLGDVSDSLISSDLSTILEGDFKDRAQ